MATTRPETARPSLAAIPSVDRLLQSGAGQELIARYGRALMLTALREEITVLRQRLDPAAPASGLDELLMERLGQRLATLAAPSLKPVFNLTGTVLHTNLGRAPLPPEAVAAIAEVAGQAANLEFDLGSGRRGDRDSHAEVWLRRLCGAEAATVVNNNAAALVLILNTLALRKEVPVSRGELVEIGGSFRLPAIMARAGCKLIEVGTTNRTHGKDYRAAINARTALLLRVHTSNYAIQGFTASLGEADLAALAHEHDLPLAHDLGSGSLLDLSRYGLTAEPTPMASIGNGVDLVCFSGDKLLGGPQCGLIVGRRKLIERLKRNPLKRALRCDKLTLAALQALLPLYTDPERVVERVPTLRLLTRDIADIEACAQRLLPPLQRRCAQLGELEASRQSCASQIGSGALPVEQLPSVALALRSGRRRNKGRSLQQLSEAFRALPKPVLGRLHDHALCFDLRCLERADEAVFVQQLDALRL